MKRKDTPGGLTSVRPAKPLRSRGFLSHHGAQPPGADLSGADPSDGTTPAKSRATRQAKVTTGKKPTALSERPAVRPFTLEDK